MILISIIAATVLMSAFFIALISIIWPQNCSRNFSKLIIIHVALAVAFLSVIACVFHFLLPDLVLSTDGGRYLNEMKLMSLDPFAWNIFSGVGPGYSASAKMGYSWTVGFFMWIVGEGHISIAVIFNIFCAVGAALSVAILIYQLSSNYQVGLIGFWFVITFPELLYWTPRITREPLSIFLVSLLFSQAIEFLVLRSMRSLSKLFIFGGGIALFIMLVRAQLSLFFPLIFALITFLTVLSTKRKRWKSVLISFVIFLFLYWFIVPVFEAQIKYVVGSRVANLLNLELFMRELASQWKTNLAKVLTPVAREGHGAAGILLAPVLLFTLMVLSLGRLRLGKEISANPYNIPVFIILLAALYVLALVAIGSSNIRFRIYIWPILSPLVAFGVYRLMGILKLKGLWGRAIRLGL